MSRYREACVKIEESLGHFADEETRVHFLSRKFVGGRCDNSGTLLVLGYWRISVRNDALKSCTPVTLISACHEIVAVPIKCHIHLNG